MLISQLMPHVSKRLRGESRHGCELLLAIISGILLALSYPLFNLYFLAWVALLPLLFAVENKNIYHSFSLGWLTGFSMFIGQIWWFKVFHIIIPFILSAYLALYFGLFCLLYNFVKKKNNISELLIVPALWISIEYIRSIGIWGFPAGLLGYSQYLNLPMIQIASLTSVFGVSFLVVLANVAIYLLLKNIPMRRKILISSSVGMILIAVLLFGLITVNQQPSGQKLTVAAVQPNVKEKNYNVHKVLNDLEKLSLKAAQSKPDLIIWPETIVRENLRMSPELAQRVYQIVKKTNAYLLLGNKDLVSGQHYNSAFLVSPQGQVIGQYNKVRPIIFWENYPIRYILPFLKNVEEKGRCDPGCDYTIFKIPKAKFATLICFEGIFPDLSRRFVNDGAQFLVNIANDGWSGSKAEHYQHASMDVFRAIENRVYYVRVGNTGVTEVISPVGRIVAELPIYQSGYLVKEILLK
ncbi:MAG: apolipoprotein N-acyltransferase [Candidatus Saganbacteria bacterium]|uniref:Apolipoprotein N-acyltransferase n=1 Tax=Candidatus Saganbacteria bacterium TaxID=2575572 RepID=A0A833NZE5_UNCSA|nr:MAG: apolipoprotein N-acyltransferase [Candidatus Saganbacteria bacterium]